MGHHIQHDLHVWLAAWYWFRGSSVLQAASGSSLGHSPLLPMRCCWPKFHLPYHKSIWLLGKHNHHHHTQICQYRGVFSAEWQSTVPKAMGLCTNGLLWVVIPNLPQVEEAAEAAEEEKDLKEALFDSFELCELSSFPYCIF